VDAARRRAFLDDGKNGRRDATGLLRVRDYSRREKSRNAAHGTRERVDYAAITSENETRADGLQISARHLQRKWLICRANSARGKKGEGGPKKRKSLGRCNGESGFTAKVISLRAICIERREGGGGEASERCAFIKVIEG